MHFVTLFLKSMFKNVTFVIIFINANKGNNKNNIIIVGGSSSSRCCFNCSCIHPHPISHICFTKNVSVQQINFNIRER